MREVGQTLGPAVVGAVALTRAATAFTHRLAATSLTAAQSGAVNAAAHEGGPLAVLSAPPTSPAAAGAAAAKSALAHGFAIGQTMTGIASLVAAVIAVVFIRGHGQEPEASADRSPTVQDQNLAGSR
jgi:hypothetical protein